MKGYTGVHESGGVITERHPDLCTVRVRMPAGVVSAVQMRKLTKIAEKYGDGSLHLTTRQTLEIPHVDPAHLEKIAVQLSKNGTPLGAEREEVVNITACPGTERCKYANIETIELAKKIDERVFGRQTPIKMRISISACPYVCTGSLTSEIGVTGRIRPLRTPGLCTGCGSCVEYCREGAISIRDGISVLDAGRCAMCGVCVHSCPYGLLKSDYMHYQITVGGRRGRDPQNGIELINVESADAVVEIIDRIVYRVYRRAWSGRSLRDQMDEIGFAGFKEEIEREFSGDTVSDIQGQSHRRTQ